MKILVTGGGGFLGSAITRRLLAEGHAVTVVARGSYPALAAAGATLVAVDIAERGALLRAAEGPAVWPPCPASSASRGGL